MTQQPLDLTWTLYLPEILISSIPTPSFLGMIPQFHVYPPRGMLPHIQQALSTWTVWSPFSTRLHWRPKCKAVKSLDAHWSPLSSRPVLLLFTLHPEARWSSPHHRSCPFIPFFKSSEWIPVSHRRKTQSLIWLIKPYRRLIVWSGDRHIIEQWWYNMLYDKGVIYEPTALELPGMLQQRFTECTLPQIMN